MEAATSRQESSPFAVGTRQCAVLGPLYVCMGKVLPAALSEGLSCSEKQIYRQDFVLVSDICYHVRSFIVPAQSSSMISGAVRCFVRVATT